MPRKRKNVINKISQGAYKVGRVSRDVNCIEKCIRKRSLVPLFKRIGNKMIGRIVNRLWFR